MMIRPLYNLSIGAYALMVKIASIKSSKAKLFIEGRKHWRRDLRALVDAYPNKEWIWIHASSLGEFEQARPIIEGIKAKDTSSPILLTFFSPSGYEVRKDYNMVDGVMYMPLDSLKNARDFVEIIPLKMALFVKYEFWLNFFESLHEKKIPLTLFSVILRPDHWLVKNQNLAKNIFSNVENVFVQDEFTYDVISSFQVTDVFLSGDTRYDRVYENSLATKGIDKIAEFKSGKRLLIVGSAWKPELDIIQNLPISFYDKWKVVIAPHELTEENLRYFESKNSVEMIRWSKIEGSVESKNILWLDTIGMLMDVYSYGDMALIGGGFGKSIHNILEPISFGLFTVFGPENKKFNEAQDAIKAEIAVQIDDKNINDIVVAFTEEKEAEIRLKCSEFVLSHIGSTKQILSHIYQ